MSTKLNLTSLRRRNGPIPPPDRQDNFDPVQKRIVTLRHGEPRPKARYVLYWMPIHRRANQNQALNFAIAQANRLNLAGEIKWMRW